MRFSRVVALAFLGALGLAIIPSIIPTGPSTAIDASGLLASGQLWFAAGAIYLGGLLTALTPCVYPLIPITVGVFGARQADSRGRAFILTTLYVVGMGVVFSALGVAAAMSGKAFGTALGNRWLVVGLAVFLIVLASSMFGAFEMALPSGVAMKLNNVGGGGFVGALLMGSVAGFLAAPCTGPVLSGVLAWVSQTQDPVLGGALLFIYAVGIGTPFFLIGVFTVRLPKGGVWMDWVKSFFGVALLALAAGYIRDAFPAVKEALVSFASKLGSTNNAIAIAAVMALVGVLMGAIHRSFSDRSSWLPKGLGVAVVVAAFSLRMAAPSAGEQHVNGWGDPSKTAEVPHFAWELTFDASKTNSAAPFEAVLAKAKEDCKPVMIDFFADWCAACNELDHDTYPAPEVIAEASRFVKIKVDGTNDHEVLDALFKQYGVQGLPTVTFINPTGEVLKDPHVIGFLPPKDFVSELRKVAMTTCSRTP